MAAIVSSNFSFVLNKVMFKCNNVVLAFVIILYNIRNVIQIFKYLKQESLYVI